MWATIAPSKVHGIGVFAIRDIPKGQRIYAIRDTEKAEWLEYIPSQTHPAIIRLIQQRWPLAFNGAPYQSPNYDVRLLSFMNHSATPNYDNHTDCALKEIKEGEEIFEDYGIHAPTGI